MIPKLLTVQIRSAIITIERTEEKRIESKLGISTYLDRLKYALRSGEARIQFQHDRLVDKERDYRFTNRFTVDDLFSDEDEIAALKRELATLGVENYIETIKDKKFKNRSEMRVFVKVYTGKDVYIKIRVELIKSSSAGVDNHVFVMSFHYAETAFKDEDFLYSKK